MHERAVAFGAQVWYEIANDCIFIWIFGNQSLGSSRRVEAARKYKDTKFKGGTRVQTHTDNQKIKAANCGVFDDPICRIEHGAYGACTRCR